MTRPITAGPVVAGRSLVFKNAVSFDFVTQARWDHLVHVSFVSIWPAEYSSKANEPVRS